MCGEKQRRSHLYEKPVGSPPRVRGKVAYVVPAVLLRQDHPRVCGEKAAVRAYEHAWQGSPPRVRGKVSDKTSPFLVARITPACAGKSYASLTACGPGEDHPRVCGEKMTAG